MAQPAALVRGPLNALDSQKPGEQGLPSDDELEEVGAASIQSCDSITMLLSTVTVLQICTCTQPGCTQMLLYLCICE